MNEPRITPVKWERRSTYAEPTYFGFVDGILRYVIVYQARVEAWMAQPRLGDELTAFAELHEAITWCEDQK